MLLVEIETEASEEEGARRRGRNGARPKGRGFDAVALAWITARGLWDGGAGGADGVERPVWALFGCEDGARAAIIANLRCGRRAREYGMHRSQRVPGRTRFEFLRSAGFEFASTRAPEGSLVQVFHRELFAFDPGVVEADGAVRAVYAPPTAWLDAQAAALGPAGVDRAVRGGIARTSILDFAGDAAGGPAEETYQLPLPHYAALATLFAAGLDRRLRAPILPDLAFQGQLFAAALREGLASLDAPTIGSSEGWWHHRAHGLAVRGIERAGIGAVVSVRGKAADAEALLAEEVKHFYRRPSLRAAGRSSAARAAAVGV